MAVRTMAVGKSEDEEVADMRWIATGCGVKLGFGRINVSAEC